MKKVALGIVLGASLMSSAAMAADQRPTYLAFSAPQAAQGVSTIAPAAPKVGKRDKAIGTLPLFVPLLGLAAVVGIVVAVSGGDDGSPG